MPPRLSVALLSITLIITISFFLLSLQHFKLKKPNTVPMTDLVGTPCTLGCPPPLVCADYSWISEVGGTCQWPTATNTWRPYTNISFNYELKYPRDWKINLSSHPDQVTLTSNPPDSHERTIYITVLPNPERKTPTEQWYRQWASQIPAGINFDALKFETITFLDKPALKVHNPRSYDLFFANGDHIFQMSWAVIDYGNATPQYIQETEAIFTLILSTFKFHK